MKVGTFGTFQSLHCTIAVALARRVAIIGLIDTSFDITIAIFGDVMNRKRISSGNEEQDKEY